MKYVKELFLLAIIFGFSYPAYSAKNVGVFMIVKGKIEVTDAKGKKKKARMGMKVYPKDTIEAKKRSRAKIVMIDKNVLNVSPDSKFQLSEYKAEGDDKNVMIELIYGKIRSKVKQKYDDKKKTYRVKTKAAVAGVRGTDFIVSHGNNKTDVITFEGKVSVGSSIKRNGSISNPVSVARGQMTSVLQNTRPQPPIKVPDTQLSNLDRDSNADTPEAPEGNEREPAEQPQEPILEENQEPDGEDPQKEDSTANREPDASTVLPPPPPPPTGEELMLDDSLSHDDALLADDNYIDDQYEELNPIIDDIIQQNNTSVNITIVAPQ